MRFTSLRHWAGRGVGSRVRGASRAGWALRRFVPSLEVLEGRALLSTYMVLNLADSGPGSLRQAVMAAEANPGPDVIAFNPAVKGTITLTSGQIPITTDLVINGPGADKLTVSGNDSSRIFAVAGGSVASTAITVSVSGLTLTHGYAASGGAIRNLFFSHLTVSGVVLANNKTAPTGPHFGSFGGAIANVGKGAFLGVSDSMLVNNTTDASTGISGNGGGIYSGGDSVTITNTIISGNQSLAGPGFTGLGGGVEVVTGSLTVNNCLITNNRVFSGAGPTSDGVYTFALGGGIEVINANTTATISNTVIAANESVGGPGGGVADGGGIDVRAQLGTTITNCLITDNRAVGGAGGGHANGGGLLDAGSNVSVSGCEFVGNQAIGPDGGFDGQAIGGAVANFFVGSMLSISDSTFVGNRALAGNGALLNVTGYFADVAEGGAISNQSEASLEVSGCTFHDNQAIGGNNAVAPATEYTPFAGGGEGGALYNALGSTAVVRDSVIEHNQAIGGNGNSATGAGADLNPPFVGYAAGGGISNNYDDSASGFGPTQLTVINTTIDHNQAIGGNGNSGNGPMAFVGDAMGGGIANYLGATANIQSSTIAHNQAVGGQGNVSTGGAAPANMGTGGGIFNALGDFNSDGLILAPSVVTITNSTLTNNQAVGGQDANGNGGDGRGGGLADFFTATSNIISSTLANNMALGGAPGSGASGGNGWGGGAFNDGYSSLTLTSSTVAMNDANGGNGGMGIGGGIYDLGLFNFDLFTVIRKNHASTSNDDIFG